MGSEDVVILDTNVFAFALGWRGPERRVYSHRRAGKLRMATSRVLLSEPRRLLE